jgi:hypothetical protein
MVGAVADVSCCTSANGVVSCWCQRVLWCRADVSWWCGVVLLAAKMFHGLHL